MSCVCDYPSELASPNGYLVAGEQYRGYVIYMQWLPRWEDRPPNYWLPSDRPHSYVARCNTLACARAWIDNELGNLQFEQPPTPEGGDGAAPRTLAARVPMMPLLALQLLKKARDKLISREVHKKLHPLV